MIVIRKLIIKFKVQISKFKVKMKYYSTNKKAPIADLHKAVVKGLAEDRGEEMKKAREEKEKRQNPSLFD